MIVLTISEKTINYGQVDLSRFIGVCLLCDPRSSNRLRWGRHVHAILPNDKGRNDGRDGRILWRILRGWRLRVRRRRTGPYWTGRLNAVLFHA